LYQQAVNVDRARLQRIGESARDALKFRIQTTDLYLRHGEDYFGSQSIITEPMFREWCMKYGWSINVPWLHGVAFYTNKNADVWRRQLPPDLATWTKADFQLFRKLAMETPIDLAFAHGYCSDTNKSWPTNYAGQSLFTLHKPPLQAEPYVEIALNVSANTPGSTTRHRVINRADNKPEYGATIAVPVYGPDHHALVDLIEPNRKPGPTSAKVFYYNWNSCRGVLLGPIDYVKLASEIWAPGPREVGLEIFAANEPQVEQWLNPSDHSPRALDSTFKAYLTASIPLPLYNRDWTVFVYTLAPFEAGSPRYLAYVTFGAGAGLTLLAASLVGVALRARSRQELMTDQIRDARDALAAAQRERERLSHDLHDNAIQSLYAIQLRLGHVAKQIDTAPESVRNEFTELQTELDAVIAETRAFIIARDGGNEAADLASVLRAMGKRAQAGAKAQIAIQCEADVSERLSGGYSVQIANIAREALSNSLRHGKAQYVTVTLTSSNGTVCLEVTDDGIGFDLNHGLREGIGLRSMQRRAEEIGGQLGIVSNLGKGTRITMKVPVETVPKSG